MHEYTKDLLELETWGDIEPQNLDEKKKCKNKILKDAQMFHATFETDAGKIVLKQMMEMFLVKSIAKPNDDMLSIGIREGQARVVRMILQQKEIAKKG